MAKIDIDTDVTGFMILPVFAIEEITAKLPPFAFRVKYIVNPIDLYS